MGKEVRAGFVQAAAWGTPGACGAGDELILQSESLSHENQISVDDSAGGGSAPWGQDVVGIACSGDLSTYLRWRGAHELFMAMVLGAAAAPVLVAGSTGAYKHVLTPAADNEGLFGTLAIDKGVSVHEFGSLKPTGFTLEGEAGQPFKLTFPTIADRLKRNTTGGTNNATTMAAVNPPNDPNGNPHTDRVIFHQGVIRLGPESGGALGVSNEVEPTRLSLGFTRDMAADFRNALASKEPLENGYPDMSFGLSWPKYGDDAYLDAYDAQTLYKAEIILTGAEIEAGFNFKVTYRLPNLKVKKAEGFNVSGPDRLKHDVEFALHKPKAETTGMEGLLLPMEVEIVSDRNTALLS